MKTTMKTTMKTLLLLVIITSTTAFTSLITVKKEIKESSIEWTGKKVIGAHQGTINLANGHLNMNGNDLVGGVFVADMTSIAVTDLEAGKGKEDLEGHLKSDDFFGVATHPTATVEITSAEKSEVGYAVKANITIKGITEAIEFDLNMDESSASTILKIDRTKFGVRYGSGTFFDNLGDKAISDIFELKINLKF